eukprot:930049_1
MASSDSYWSNQMTMMATYTKIQQHLSSLSAFDINIKTKAIKLLRKICDNIISNPTELKYQDLNFVKIHQKLNKCSPAIELLYDVGFKPSNDGLRLKCDRTGLAFQFIVQLRLSLKDSQLSFKDKSSSQDKATKYNFENESIFSKATNIKNESIFAKQLRELHVVFKAPNDLPSQIAANAKKISELQTQNASDSVIQQLSDHREALVFVHELETSAQTDLESKEALQTVKEMVEVWFQANIVENCDSSDGSVSRKLEAPIILMKQQIEMTLQMKKSMQLQAKVLKRARDEATKSRNELHDMMAKFSNALHDQQRGSTGKEEEKVYDPYDIDEKAFGAFIVEKVSQKTALRVFNKVDEDEAIQPSQIITVLIYLSVLHLKYIEKIEKRQEMKLDKEKLKQSLMPSFKWILENKFGSESNVSCGLNIGEYKLLGNWLIEYYESNKNLS